MICLLGRISINARKGQPPPLVAHQFLSDHFPRLRVVLCSTPSEFSHFTIPLPPRKPPHKEGHYD